MRENDDLPVENDVSFGFDLFHSPETVDVDLQGFPWLQNFNLWRMGFSVRVEAWEGGIHGDGERECATCSLIFGSGKQIHITPGLSMFNLDTNILEERLSHAYIYN